ncbi:MAG TPA: TonB-dependent receptor plug domain-containing protein [Longimicrobium sp.]
MLITRHRLARAALTAACALAVLPAASPAQAPQEVVLVRVSDAGSGAPVEGADVWLGRNRVATDAQGRALLPRAPGASLSIRRLGYEHYQRGPFGDGWELAVALVPVPVSVAGVSATSRRQPHSPMLRRFYERKERGRGAFLTRDELDRRKPRRLVDAFRDIPGIRVVPTSRGEILQVNGTTPFMYTTGDARRGECPVQYYLDGMSWEPDLPGVISNDIRPDEVEGIEVYRRLSEVPTEFRRPGSECGVVLIWLKERV